MIRTEIRCDGDECHIAMYIEGALHTVDVRRLAMQQENWTYEHVKHGLDFCESCSRERQGKK